MRKRLSRQQKKQLLELDRTGIAIEDVYGSRKASPLFLCLSKALIISMVCIGTVTGFCDAFSLNYNKLAIVLFTLACSVLISLLYFKKKVFYIGYFVFLMVFTLELIRYYLYANSGFQAITNRVREVYADYFDMDFTRTAEEYYTNRQLTITIALIFIISFLIIMYNITVSRYMNFAETFGISFILLQIPLYAGYKPPMVSIILIMTGCICTGMLQKGAFNRVTIPGKNAPDYIKDKIFKKTYYTTRGSHAGILMVLGFSVAFSFIVSVLSIPLWNREQAETPEGSAKAVLDDTLKILVQNGIYGLFNRYDSLNGLNRGLLGGVSAVNPDFQTDLVVSFVPMSKETVYLPGFKGVTYHGSYWSSRIDSTDYPELGLDNVSYVDAETVGVMDFDITRKVLKEESSVSSRMQISYIDKSFGMQVYPYITYPENVYSAEEELYLPAEDSDQIVHDTEEALFFPLESAAYIDADDLFLGKNLSNYSGLLYSGYVEDLDKLYAENISDELSGRVSVRNRNTGDSSTSVDLSYYKYIYDVCTSVPADLDRYLGSFCDEHGNFGLDGYTSYKALQNKLNRSREEMSYAIYESKDEKYLTELYNDKAAVNDFRIKACEAIRDMFLVEYPYTLSPGKTPSDSDFVQYFLEKQKRGLCSHFASAAVMILRHLGIPARYMEGYCIPYSLVTESGKKLEQGGDYWYSADNEFNPGKKLYSVEVSDYYAHAWIEVYLEGKGFVPFEVTPPSYEAAPQAGAVTGIGKFFSQILNVDLGLGNSSSDSSLSISATEDVSVVFDEDSSNEDLHIFFYPMLMLSGAVVVFWLLFLLIKKIISETRYSRYLKEGRFNLLVYGRYNDLIRRLKRKKVVKAANPLPLELCELLSEYLAVRELESHKEKNAGIQDENDSERKAAYDMKYSELIPIFTYVERVLYSDYQSDADEYQGFYKVIKSLR